VSDLTLVRFWEDGFHTAIGTEFVNWDKGWFTLASGTPLARKLWDAAARGSILLTVYSTDELVWAIDHAAFHGDRLVVCSKPWLQQLRRSLASDDYMIEAWLAAEKRHRDAVAGATP
jgi:hypothetical protein